MPAEIVISKKGSEETRISLRPGGEPVSIETPAGMFNVLGTKEGFAVRRQNGVGQADIKYGHGQTLKISNPDGTIEISAEQKPSPGKLAPTPYDQWR